MKVIYSIVIASLLSFGSAVYAEELMANLPPDPGAAGKATLAGIDSDGDGVRDDVQRWIVMSYPNSQKTKAALTQRTKTMQQFILDAADKNKTFINDEEMSKSGACLAYVRPDDYYDVYKRHKSIVLNTYLRSKAWLQADHHLSGTFSSALPARKQGCGFNPDVMAN